MNGLEYTEEELHTLSEQDDDDACPYCAGTGEGQYDGVRCWHCKGSGAAK